MSSKKTIILCAPADFGLFESIKNGLEKLDFKVFGFPIQDADYSYKNFSVRIHNTFRKLVFNDRSFKNKLKYADREQELMPKLEGLENIDFALFIRPDMYPIPFIKAVEKIAAKTTAYQWDSLDRFPAVYNYLDLFKKFYVFDQRDIHHRQHLVLTTNFSLDSLNAKDSEERNDAYLLASFDQTRLQQAIALKDLMHQAGVTARFMLNTKKTKELKQLETAGLIGITKSISYSENLTIVQSSKVLVDLHNTSQLGLSFRIMESIFYKKKLITTNKEVEKYDLYNPNNIFIWDEKNDEDLNAFLQTPYMEVDSLILQKYSLANWINYVFAEQPFIEINMPY